jgi:uncharacterized protein (TIGR03437 family)
MVRVPVCVIALWTVAAPRTAFAQTPPVQFNSRPAWAASVTSFTTIEFEGIAPIGGFAAFDVPSGFTQSGVNFVGVAPSSPFPYYLRVVDPAFAPTNFDWGSGAVLHGPPNFVAPSGVGGPGSSIRITLPSNVTAVGTDIMSFLEYASSFQVTVTTAAGSTNFNVSSFSYPNRAFVGFTSSVPILSLQFIGLEGFPTLDNFSTGAFSESTSMDLGPQTLEFSGAPGSGPQSMAVRIASSNGTLSWAATSTPLNGIGWLALSQQSGTAVPNVPFILRVTVEFSNLAVGFYQGEVAVRDTARNVTFKVHVLVTVVSGTQGRMEISQDAFFFQAAVGGFPPPGQILRVFNQGSGNMQWSIPAADLQSTPQWLNFSAIGGVSPALSSSATALAVNPVGLAEGMHQKLIGVNASGAANSPKLISVTLLVSGPGSSPRPELSRYGLLFTATQAGPPANPQELVISNAGGGGLTANLSATTTSGVPWLQLSQGFVSTGTGPKTVQITVNQSIVVPGIHRGKITASFSTGGSREVEVILVVAPANSLTLQRDLPGAMACAPQSMDFALATIGNGVSVPVSFPRAVLAQVVNNCAEVVNNATVVATIEGPSIVLQAVGGGLYSGNWTPERETASIPVSMTAAHPDLPTVQKTFTISSTTPGNVTPLPVLAPNGVVEGAGFTALRPLVPGSIISVFGARFATGDNLAGEVPLPRTLGGVSVRIGGENAPLYYAGAGQVNAQVPADARPGESISVAVSVNGRITAPQNYLIAPAQPGVFKAGNFAAVLDANFAQINTNNPARRGDTIQIFANGLGLTNEPVTTGERAPSFSTVQNPVLVTIGGVNVPVSYQGWAPGFVGLHQVNVVLTQDVPTGDSVPLVIRQNGVESNPNLPVSIPVQ